MNGCVSAFHMADDDDTLYVWPLKGTIQPGSTRRTLVLENTSRWFHEGMSVVLRRPGAEPDDEDAVSSHAVERYEDSGVLHLRHELEDDPVGMEYVTTTRDTGLEVESWMPVEVVQMINCLTDEAKQNARNKEWQYQFLSSADLTLHAESTAEELEAGWIHVRSWLEQVRSRGHQLQVLGNGTELQLQRYGQMQNLMKVACNVYEILRSEIELKRTLEAGGDSMTATHTAPWWYHDERKEDNKIAILLDYLLACTYRETLRKRGRTVYQQVYTVSDIWRPQPDNPRCLRCGDPASHGPAPVDDEVVAARLYCAEHAEGMPDCVDLRRDLDGRLRMLERSTVEFGTRTWRPMLNADNKPVDVRDWIHRVINRTMQRQIWETLVRGYMAHISACEAFMVSTHDAAFPVYTPNRYMFSFRNGLYDIYRNIFYPFGRVLPDVCCISYIDQLFDPVWTTAPLHSLEMVVDGYATIVRSQNFNQDMSDWLDAFIGRLFFKVNDRDKWEKLLVIKGWAATGKSTIAKAVGRIIGEVNVGYIPSNCEEQWALMSVHDRYLWMCLELKANFRLPTGVMQSMVSGETVIVHEKCKAPIEVLWSTQGLLVGNELPLAWTADAMNALVRRVVSFPFDMPPKHMDSSVGTRFMNNLPKFLARTTRMYKQKCEQVGDGDVNTFLPERLRKAIDDFKRSAQPLLKFIEESSEIEIAPREARRAILRYIIETQGISPLLLGFDLEAVMEFPDMRQPGGITFMADPGTFLDEWCIPAETMQQLFKRWNDTSNGGRRAPAINNADAYRPAAMELFLAVVSGVRCHSGVRTKEHWYGIRHRQVARDMQPNGMLHGIGLGGGGGGGGSGGRQYGIPIDNDE